MILQITHLFVNIYLIIDIIYLKAIMTMVPEAWQGNKLMSQEKQDFYRWISCSMEAWDGPGENIYFFPAEHALMSSYVSEMAVVPVAGD